MGNLQSSHASWDLNSGLENMIYSWPRSMENYLTTLPDSASNFKVKCNYSVRSRKFVFSLAKEMATTNDTFRQVCDS